MIIRLLNEASAQINKVVLLAQKTYKCKILGKGCFVAGTPVWMAGNSIGRSGKIYAFAAAMPFAVMPVEDVPLLSYAPAHKTVNTNYTTTASSQEVYMGLVSGDPYTSAEQKQRDRYEINDTDWYAVSFEQIGGSSSCRLALHSDWIQSRGFVVDGIITMNLPEQGISGPFRITAIKHILPQKKPESDPGDDYEWKPVTGLFTHTSDQVYTIVFANGETLGVTAPHPIFSTTYHDWRPAGALETGEKVLTYGGEVTVASLEKKVGKVVVYNLEVKDWHNFLVGEVGVVVHNTGNCFDEVRELLKNFVNHNKVGARNGAIRNGNKIDLPDGRSIPISAKEFPDFTGFTARTTNGTPLANKFSNLKGDSDRLFDNNKANEWLQNSGFLNEFESYWIDPTFGSPVKLKKNGVEKIYTWHHHENGLTMMLVEQLVHNSVQHLGGASLIKSGATKAINDFEKIFPDPNF